MGSTLFLPEIRNRYAKLTPAEKRIADYVLRYPSEVLALSAATLSQRAGTASSAVIRFCKALGYSGFSDFKLQLAMELSRQAQSSYMPGVCREDSTDRILEKIFAANMQALQDTLSRFDREAFRATVEQLSCARTIHIYGVGTSSGLVNELRYRLMLLGIPSQSHTDTVEMQLSTMNLSAGDVAVGISHSGRTRATVDSLAKAKAAGVSTVCLTSYSASPITRVSDRVLTVYCDETRYPIEAMSARIAQTGVIDALIAALSVRNYEKATRQSQKIHDLLEEIRYDERK